MNAAVLAERPQDAKEAPEVEDPFMLARIDALQVRYIAALDARRMDRQAAGSVLHLHHR